MAHHMRDTGPEGDGDRPTGSSRAGSSPLAVIAGEDALQIGDVDVMAARAVLAELGAGGATALDTLSPAETITALTRLRELSGAIAAVQARALVHLESAVEEECLHREEPPRRAARIARAEVSMALRQSSSCAGQSLATSRRLVRSMPRMLTALAEGEVTAEVAHRVGRTMSPATPEQRTQVDEILGTHLGSLVGCGPQEWAGEAAAVLHGLDPEGEAERHRRAKAQRSVTVRRTEHGMCTLTATLPALDGARIRKGLSLAAERARSQGDRRGHQQIMADLLGDALIGRGDGIDPSTLEIGVIITDRSLLAPGHADPATIEGLGPVPFDHVREAMLETLTRAEEDPELAMALRILHIDQEDGQLMAVDSVSRRFPPALARFLRLAHQTCRAPHCDAAIRQNDHIVPWAESGPTSLDNGNGLCAADNQKEEAGERARVIRDDGGRRRTVEWTSRYGQTARRGGINFDPLGTGRRLLERERRRAGPVSISAPQAAVLRAVELIARHGTGSSDDPEPGDPAPIERAGRHPAASRGPRSPHGSHWPRPRRLEHVFLPGLVVVSDAPCRGDEAAEPGP